MNARVVYVVDRPFNALGSRRGMNGLLITLVFYREDPNTPAQEGCFLHIFQPFLSIASFALYIHFANILQKGQPSITASNFHDKFCCSKIFEQDRRG